MTSFSLEEIPEDPMDMLRHLPIESDLELSPEVEIVHIKVDKWLKITVRRKCLNRVSEIKINRAMAAQLESEACRLDLRAEEAITEHQCEVLAEMHRAKARTLREQSIISL